MSPLQLSVYWRLALAHFFTSFLFFLDVYAAAAVSCRHGNGTEEGGNRSRPAEDSDGGKRNVSGGHFRRGCFPRRELHKLTLCNTKLLMCA